MACDFAKPLEASPPSRMPSNTHSVIGERNSPFGEPLYRGAHQVHNFLPADSLRRFVVQFASSIGSSRALLVVARTDVGQNGCHGGTSQVHWICHQRRPRLKIVRRHGDR